MKTILKFARNIAYILKIIFMKSNYILNIILMILALLEGIKSYF